VRIFHFYRKETSHPIGYVADFCPIEREITTCQIYAVHSSQYLSFVCLDKGGIIRRDRRCCSCGIVIPDEKAEYRNIIPEKKKRIEDVEQETNPGVSERYRDFIELRRQIERGLSVDADLKNSLLKEQFSWLERIAAQFWTGETKLDRVSFLSAVASMTVWFIALVVVSDSVPQGKRLDVIGVFFVIGLGLMVVNAVIFFLGPHRIIGKQVIPLIVAAMSPLHPSKDEIETIFSQMRAEGFRYSTKVGTGRLIKAIERQRKVRS
jgi:hypothetical protein